MNRVQSPFTGHEAKAIHHFSTKDIVDQYRSDFGIDVSSYFRDQDGRIALFECPDSGLRFFSPASLAGDSPFYQNLAKAHKTYYEVEKWEHEMALKEILEKAQTKKDLAILEIGCAEGAFLNKVKSLLPDARLYGLDINEVAIEKAKQSGINASVAVIEEFQPEGGMRFDVVCTFQVLEHIAKVKTYLESGVAQLNEGGILIVAVPNSDSFILKRDTNHTLNLPPHHMGWWNERSLRSLEKFFSLETMSIVKEPTDLKNPGAYYDAWLKSVIGKATRLVYPLTRWLAKPLVPLFIKSGEGMSILAVYRKK